MITNNRRGKSQNYLLSMTLTSKERPQCHNTSNNYHTSMPIITKENSCNSYNYYTQTSTLSNSQEIQRKNGA